MALAAQSQLFRMGFAVISPQLTWFSRNSFPEEYDTYLQNGLTLIEHCDAVWRLPGESRGADIECNHAIDRGIKVFKSRREIEACFKIDPLKPGEITPC